MSLPEDIPEDRDGADQCTKEEWEAAMSAPYQYKAKPVVIEAFQITAKSRADNSDWPNWLNDAWQKDEYEIGSVHPTGRFKSDGTDRLEVKTINGWMIVDWGDWIIKDHTGELSVKEPDYFERSYDKVN